MRSAAVALGLACASVLWCPAPAGADPPAYGPAERVCRVTDPRLAELSGLVADASGWLAVNDGGERLEVYVLTSDCAVRTVRRAEVDPYDVEDLALAADGTVWLADIGDNAARRDTVALHALRPDGTTPLYRLRYPDGAHDAEALLLDPRGTPYVVTKNVLGRSGVYAPAGPMVAAAGGAGTDTAVTGLQRVGEVRLTPTGTPGGPVGALGQVLVTGGAVSADGSLVALRTYTDAYVWTLPDGADPGDELSGTPARIPLPAQPQGEAIAFAADGRSLVIASEGVPGDLLRLPAIPVTSDPTGPTTDATPSPVGAAAPVGAGGQGPLGGAPVGVAVAGTAALALVVAAVARARRRGR